MSIRASRALAVLLLICLLAPFTLFCVSVASDVLYISFDSRLSHHYTYYYISLAMVRDCFFSMDSLLKWNTQWLMPARLLEQHPYGGLRWIYGGLCILLTGSFSRFYHAPPDLRVPDLSEKAIQWMNEKDGRK